MDLPDAPSFVQAGRTAVLALAVIGFSACSGDSEADPVASSETGIAAGDATSDVTGDASITIVDFAFGEPLTVDAGTTVVVVNDDGAAHTVTAGDGSFDTGVVDAGTATELTLDDPGEFGFFCDIHTSMTGSITVAG